MSKLLNKDANKTLNGGGYMHCEIAKASFLYTQYKTG